MYASYSYNNLKNQNIVKAIKKTQIILTLKFYIDQLRSNSL